MCSVSPFDALTGYRECPGQFATLSTMTWIGYVTLDVGGVLLAVVLCRTRVLNLPRYPGLVYLTLLFWISAPILGLLCPRWAILSRRGRLWAVGLLLLDQINNGLSLAWLPALF